MGNLAKFSLWSSYSWWPCNIKVPMQYTIALSWPKKERYVQGKTTKRDGNCPKVDIYGGKKRPKKAGQGRKKNDKKELPKDNKGETVGLSHKARTIKGKKNWTSFHHRKIRKLYEIYGNYTIYTKNIRNIRDYTKNTGIIRIA